MTKMIELSNRIQEIPASPTLAISAKAKELVNQGVDVVSFSAGEPDFDTPAIICDEAKKALDEGKTHYTAVGGVNELKDAIAAYYKDKIGQEYSRGEIAASCGAKHTLYNLALTLINPGDEVMIPAPYWVSYPAQVNMAGGKPVKVKGKASNGFVPTVDELDAAYSDKTKVLMLNNPTNPTGAFWHKEGLEDIAEWLKDHPQVTVISDAIYSELVYDGLEYVELLELAPELRDRYIIVDGISKAFAMTGWRLGYALAPEHVISAMQKLQSQSTSNPNSMTQFATVKALQHKEEIVAPMRKSFQKRRDLIYDLLTDIDGVELVKPQGAFYAFPDISSCIGKSFNGETIEDDFDFANYLLDEARVAVVPGSAFGSPGFVRMSYASAEETIEEGCKRLKEAVEALG
jgi:aspartate aminotransferase